MGSIYVPRLVASSQALYGTLGIVFATLAWLLFFGRLLVYANVLNVVRLGGEGRERLPGSHDVAAHLLDERLDRLEPLLAAQPADEAHLAASP